MADGEGDLMKRIALIPLVLAVASLAAALAVAASGSPRTVSPAARAVAIERTWRANLRSGALADPKQHFPNPALATLNARLRLAASRYRFTVVSVQILRPRQTAPFVVIKAKDKH